MLLLCRVFHFNLVPSVDSWIESLCGGRSAQKSCWNLCLDVLPFCFPWLASASQVLNTVNFLTQGKRCSNSILHINSQFVSTICWIRCLFFLLRVFFLFLCQNSGGWSFVGLFLSSLFHSIGLTVCFYYFYASIWLSFSLQPCCIIWDGVLWYLQACSFSLGLLWLCVVFCDFIWIFEWLLIVLWRMASVFWWELHGVRSILLIVWPFSYSNLTSTAVGGYTLG